MLLVTLVALLAIEIESHVSVLAASIALRGLIVPLVVRPDGERFELVAGFHRFAACQRIELPAVPVIVRARRGVTADRAAENVVRKPLTPLEEAHAVQAMLEDGYTLDGTATVLGWARQRVSARAKILELPTEAQRLIGSGNLPVTGIDALLAIAAVSSGLCHCVVEVIASAAREGGELGARFARDPGWVIDHAIDVSDGTVWAAHLGSVHGGQLAELKLGKKTDTLFGEAETLHSGLDRYAYGPPRIDFTEGDVDQARAAGVLLELTRTPLILDRRLYRELAKTAVARTVETLRARTADQAEERAEARRENRRPIERSPLEQLEADHRAHAREFAARAHGVNLDLGAGLLDDSPPSTRPT